MNCERARAASGQLELAPIRTLKPDALRSGLGAALALARRQGTTQFECARPSMISSYTELYGEPARAAIIPAASRFPTNSAWPELARAEAAFSEDLPPI
jgi:hypothetical protein